MPPLATVAPGVIMHVDVEGKEVVALLKSIFMHELELPALHLCALPPTITPILPVAIPRIVLLSD